MIYPLSLIFGFFIGGLPFGLFLGRMKGIDVRKVGSGNIGATNVYRVVGPIYGLITLVLDGLKGFIPVLIAPSLSLNSVLVGVGAVLGHIFSPYLKFKGGKGVTTTFGVLLALAPLSFLIGVLFWFLIAFLSSYASVASLSIAVILPVLVLIAKSINLREGNLSNLIFVIAVGIAIWVMHRTNIKRLIRGEEPKLRWRRG